MKRLLIGMAGLVVLGGLGAVTAQDAANADLARDFHISSPAGAWLICVHSFTGPQAALLAQEMVQVLRRDYQLAAYLFDRGGDERRKQQQQFEELRKNCPEGRFRGSRIEEQFAVLVGGYKDMESARKALEAVRQLKPPPDRFCIMGQRVRPGKSDSGENGVWIEEIRISPFSTAFVVRNPTAPPEQPDDKPDPFLKKLNAGQTYSLLNCSKTWTLVVKVFYGTVAIQSQSAGSKFLELVGWSGKQQLTGSAVLAHDLARLLRSQQPPFEAYVLHTRNSSIVTVGGYDQADDPQLLQNQRTLAKMQLTDGNRDPSKRVVLMELLPQPVPMQIPKF